MGWFDHIVGYGSPDESESTQPRLETAPNRRSKCFICKARIDRGELRLGSSNPRYMGAVRWRHVLCCARFMPDLIERRAREDGDGGDHAEALLAKHRPGRPPPTRKADSHHAVQLAEEGAWGDLLDVLVAWWRHTRASILASCVREVSERLSLDRPPKNTDDDTVAEVVRGRQPSDLAWLLDALAALPARRAVYWIHGVYRLGDADPRWGDAIARWLHAPPHRSSEHFWWGVVEMMDVIDDPRLIGVLEEHPPELVFGSRSMVDVMSLVWPRMIEHLRERYSDGAPRLDADAEERIEHIRELAQQATSAKRKSSGVATSEELLRRVHANPDDLGLKLIFADTLQQAGDIRGEFIALGCADRTSPACTKRLRELQRKHWRALLGELASCVLASGLIFRDGFVDTCVLRPRTERHLAVVADSPAWSTVRDLELRPSPACTRPFSLLEHAGLPRLEVIRGVRRSADLHALLFGQVRSKLREIHCVGGQHAQWEEDATPPARDFALPALQRLVAAPVAIPTIAAATAAGAQVGHLVVDIGEDDGVRTIRECVALLETNGISVLDVVAPHWSLHVSSDGDQLRGRCAGTEPVPMMAELSGVVRFDTESS